MSDSFDSFPWQQYLLYPGTALMAKVQNAAAFNHPASQNGTQPSSGAAPYYYIKWHHGAALKAECEWGLIVGQSLSLCGLIMLIITVLILNVIA